MADSFLINSILFLPLFAFAICQFFYKKHKNLAGIIFCVFCFIGLSLSAYLYLNNDDLSRKVISLNWFKISNINFNLSFLLDRFTYQMLILVNFISLLVGVFSIEYMRSDAAKPRYFGFIGLFLFSMIGVILSGNLFQMYFFWELVGFSSYLLIGFWYKKASAIEASKKAFLVNRIGDVCFLIGIFMCFNQFGTTEIGSLKITNDLTVSTLIGLLLFCGCIAKSAQFPLHIWLPDAMEGPTPISALIHAATMVAAGIYLIIRVFPIFTPDALIVITVIGCISMLMAGVKAITQTDIKKVLAYSTISQLGLMVVAIGGSAPDFAFNHLITHAFFKAGLFLAAGSVIYSIHEANHSVDAQNMYLMGGLRKKMPVTFYSYMICAGAMVGLPFFSGFITKDHIIELWFLKKGIFNQIVFISLLASTVVSATYMTRQAWLIFWGKPRYDEPQSIHIQENSYWIKIPIIILAACSTILIGKVFKIEMPELSIITLINTILAVSGILITYFFRYKLMGFAEYSSKIDLIYTKLIVRNTVLLSNKISFFDNFVFDGLTKLLTTMNLIISDVIKWFDTFLIDGLVSFVIKFINRLAKIFTKFQSGQFQWYISAMMLIIFLIFILSSTFEK